MCKKVVFGFTLILVLHSLSPSADPFYTNLLNEGKQFYLAGKYNEALEDFKIAEFGLLDEKEIVPELYFYYALTHFKKSAVGESKALLEKMKMALGRAEIDTLAKPKEIEGDISIMSRVLKYLEQPGARTGSLPFYTLFYETWDLLKIGKMFAAETNIRRLDKMGGDEARLSFLEGVLAFQKHDYKKCVKNLEKVVERQDVDFSEDAQFYLAYSYFKRGDNANGAKYARMSTIRNPDYVHRLMALMEEIKAGQQEEKAKKNKK